MMGFAHLQPPFTIQCVSAEGDDMPSFLAFLGLGRKETSRLPTSATCFNLLKVRLDRRRETVFRSEW